MFSVIVTLTIKIRSCFGDLIVVGPLGDAVKHMLRSEFVEERYLSPILDDGNATPGASAKLAPSFSTLIGRTTFNAHNAGNLK